jgi:Protein of unknown function (DUF4019)
MDAQKYGASYESAAPTFQKKVTKEQWQSEAATVHAKTGDLKSRKLLKGQKMSTLPGMPPGSYAILQYRSVFANLPNGIETAVLELDGDKKWRVDGYFVKPAPEP